MGQIGKAHQTEDQRKSGREKEQQSAERQTIEALNDPELHEAESANAFERQPATGGRVFASGATILARKPITGLSKASAEFGPAQDRITEPRRSARSCCDSTLSRWIDHCTSSFVVPAFFFCSARSHAALCR
jgi:hypothetical protein